MFKPVNRINNRRLRHKRVRKKVQGDEQRPRLSVYRSNKHFHVQLIDDTSGKTLVGVSTLDASIKGKVKNMASRDGAKLIGNLVAEKAKEKSIEKVVFDRGGLSYHGAIKELADALRGAGLKF
jgi:large subunit ribosomal protein L18